MLKGIAGRFDHADPEGRWGHHRERQQWLDKAVLETSRMPAGYLDDLIYFF